MELYIKIENGEPVGHPATKENIEQAFAGIDLTDPNCGFVKFKKVPKPPLSVYHKLEEMIYVKTKDVYTGIYPIRNLTPPEKLQVQNAHKEAWANSTRPKSWVFNEEYCEFLPPVPRPNDSSKPWVWDEDTVSWVDGTDLYLNRGDNTQPAG